MATKVLDQQGLIELWGKINGTFARVRRDNDYNYSETFVPQNKEICFVDTAKNGLRAKIGDGSTSWINLPYIDEAVYSAIDKVIQSGYYEDGVFYTDSEHTARYDAAMDTIYIDVAHSLIYVYDGTKYISVRDSLPTASATQAGIVKLYDTKGNNIDGTITQRLFTEEIERKIEAAIQQEDELLILK